MLEVVIPAYAAVSAVIPAHAGTQGYGAGVLICTIVVRCRIPLGPDVRRNDGKRVATTGQQCPACGLPQAATAASGR
ncbi:MAG: hypothetical protein ACREO8_10455 [Luteimonas sp.]